MKRPVAHNREMQLHDGDLELRPWREDDLDAVVEAAEDPYTREIEHMDDPRAWLVTMRDRGEPAIVVGGQVVGGISIGSWQPGRGALGYFVLERFRGRGFATRAAQLIVRWALTDGGYIRVAAAVEPSNAASIRVLEHAGLRREGLMRSYVIYGDRVGDAYLYAAVRGDF
jgi:RimJ/RimL family protein N-acetyltransferase